MSHEDKLDKYLNQIRRLVGHPVVKDAPSWVHTFDKMIIVYLDEAHKRMYQVIAFDTKSGTIKGAF